MLMAIVGGVYYLNVIKPVNKFIRSIKRHTVDNTYEHIRSMLLPNAIQNPFKPYWSALDRSKKVDKENFVVSIVRNEDGKNPEHVYLVVEGFNKKGMSLLFRAHLVQGDNSRLSKVLIDKYCNLSPKELHSRVIFDWFKNGELCMLVWQIDSSRVQDLIDIIKADEIGEIEYSSVGNEALINRMTLRRATRTHSCFTWAREMLEVLENPDIEKHLKPRLGAFIAEVPSAYITPKGNKADPGKYKEQSRNTKELSRHSTRKVKPI